MKHTNLSKHYERKDFQMKNFKHDVGKRIASVTLMPTFMLGFQGWVDSRKGEKSIPDARVEGLKNRCTAIEKKEVLLIESRYEPVRKAGSKALSKISNCKANECSIPAISDDSSPYSIRSNARNEAKRASVRAEAEQAKIKLLDVKESLIHADTVLSERIRRTREKALKVKIAAYVKGVRKGKLPDYSPDLEMEDDAYQIYISNHKKCDDLIFNTAEKLTQEVV